MAKVNFLTKLSHICQKAAFLNFMVMPIRKPDQKMKVLYLGSNGKNSKIFWWKEIENE